LRKGSLVSLSTIAWSFPYTLLMSSLNAPFPEAMTTGSGCQELRTPALQGIASSQLWQGGEVLGASGRGAAFIVSTPVGMAVRKHYQRGGLLRTVLKDRYWFRGWLQTRSFAEYQLLYALNKQGLPVPEPLAARVLRQGFRYQADLLTQHIPDSQTLHQHLSSHPVSKSLAEQLGVCIARFHRLGVYHADLNAHNILIDAHGEIVLIDFDKSCIRAPHHSWQRGNILRLKRSLAKLCHLSDEASEAPFWRPLLARYLKQMA
jgi:3-deoxy-D-manno-octulosonic acid kinase